MRKSNHITGYILAGGRSSRMGAEKGLLPLKGKPVIQHIIDQLLPVVDSIVIVSNNAAYASFGIEVIADIIPGKGPAGGIHTALTHSKTSRNFIISCDMPFVTTAAIQYMLHQTSDADVVLPVHENKLEPLFGIYSKNCHSGWEALMRKDLLKLQKIVDCFSLLKLDVTGNALFSHPLFVNINTLEELEAAAAIRNNRDREQ